MADNKLHATERLNSAAQHVHTNSVLENLQVLNAQNATIADAVKYALPALERFITVTLDKIKSGGRIFYIGAGTAGRLGVLDASEMPPTYGTDPELIQGIIAGGDGALRNSIEGTEDDPQAGRDAIKDLKTNDVLIGVSASGGAVFVRAAVQDARKRGIYTAAICTAPDAPLLKDVDCAILAPTVAEIPAGSTRMFSGTAQKMILNMISTSIMIALGKVYAGYMIDVRISNEKLEQRAVKMVATLTGCSLEHAQDMISQCKKHTFNPVKPAVVAILENLSCERAMDLLKLQDNRIDAIMAKHGRDTILGS